MQRALSLTFVLLASATCSMVMAQQAASNTPAVSDAVLASSAPVRTVCEDPVPGGTKAVPFTMPAKPKKTTARMAVNDRAAQWARRS